MLPIETVVDVIIANADHCESGDLYVYVKDSADGLLEAESMDELAAKVREYLQSLIPPPVLLSECEEDSPVVVKDRFGEWGVAIRVGEIGYSMHDDPRHRKPLGYAETVRVIQPVEVNRDRSA